MYILLNKTFEMENNLKVSKQSKKSKLSRSPAKNKCNLIINLSRIQEKSSK